MRLFALVLIFFTHPLFSQNILLLKNGQQLPFNKIKLYEDHVRIISISGQKIEIDTADLCGYYDDQTQSMHFKKPYDSRDGGWNRFKYQLIQTEAVGRITLYSRTYNRADGTYGTFPDIVLLYAEKDGVFANIYTTDTEGGMPISRSSNLMHLVQDDPEILKKMKSVDFRYNGEHIFSLVQEYNLRNYQAPDVKPLQQTATVSFYTKVGPEISKNLVLKVNDSIEYKLIEKFPTPIKLPAFTVTKVCLKWEGGETCTIVSPIPFAVSYFELEYATLRKFFVIEKRTENQVRSYTASYVLKKL
jgi:hypothetical protein